MSPASASAGLLSPSTVRPSAVEAGADACVRACASAGATACAGACAVDGACSAACCCVFGALFREVAGAARLAATAAGVHSSDDSDAVKDCADGKETSGGGMPSAAHIGG
eukprot:2370398-Pleurochrysis_carterae.AAC.2